MDHSQQSLDTLRDIRSIMDRSSRFISLSGWSGIAAGLCAITGAWQANRIIEAGKAGAAADYTATPLPLSAITASPLFAVAMLTFVAALAGAYIFTYLRSRKTNTPVWGATARRLVLATAIPMLAGGLLLIKLIQAGQFDLVAPGCLIFYGLALLNASRYTLGEIRLLGYAILVTGLIGLMLPGNGLLLWAFGFGILHIIYGTLMWWRYERNPV